jgi:hypothetical protein
MPVAPTQPAPGPAAMRAREQIERGVIEYGNAHQGPGSRQHLSR